MNAPFAYLLSLVLILAPACVTPPGGGPPTIDWEIVSTELDLAEQDIRGIANAATDPDDAEKLNQLADHLATADDALEAWLEAGGEDADGAAQVLAAIQAALALAETFVDEDDQIWVELAKSLLRRAEAYLPKG